MPSLLPAPPHAASPWRRRLLIAALLAALLMAMTWLWLHRMGEPDDYDHMEAQFKYGSIGADHPLAQAPLPYWMWKVLPEVLPLRQVFGLPAG